MSWLYGRSSQLPLWADQATIYRWKWSLSRICPKPLFSRTLQQVDAFEASSSSAVPQVSD
jgi:hypothetical protein